VNTGRGGSGMADPPRLFFRRDWPAPRCS